MDRAEEMTEGLMDWFRFYHEALDDPKVQMLEPRLFKAWVNLLCIAHRHDGRLPNITVSSFMLRMSESDCTDVIFALKSVGLLDDIGGIIEPHNWKGRQYQSDSSTNRVRKYRDMKRFSNVSSAVTVTPSDTDTDTDTETDTESETDTEADKTLARARRARSSYTPAFEAFWEAYPRRIGKAAAFKAFSRAKAPLEEIMAGLGRFVSATVDADMKFVPHPTTWLNQERWNDDSHAIAPSGRSNEANAFLDAIDGGQDGSGIRTTGYRPSLGHGNGLAATPIVVTLPTIQPKR